MMTGLEFGVQLWQEQFSYEEMVEAMGEVEDLGYDSAWLYDHFYPMSEGTSWDIPESWTLLSALAAETDDIDLGVLVTCNSYRNPAVLAKIAATVDVISGGRLQFGIGAGWHEEEHNAYDIQFPDAITRIEMLSESVSVIKRIWTENKVNYEGNYYQIDGLVSYPKPLQEPHPPVLIGGKGDSTLKVVAERADKSNFVDCSVEEFRERLEVLKDHCSEVGRDFEDIEKTWHGHVVLSDTEKDAKEKALRFKEENAIEATRKMDEEKFLDMTIFGTPEQCVDQLQKFVDLGVSYFIPHFPFDRGLEPQREFMNKVVPKIC